MLGHVGLMLGSCWPHVGLMYGLLLGHIGAILGRLEAMRGNFFGPYLRAKNKTIFSTKKLGLERPMLGHFGLILLLAFIWLCGSIDLVKILVKYCLSPCMVLHRSSSKDFVKILVNSFQRGPSSMILYNIHILV